MRTDSPQGALAESRRRMLSRMRLVTVLALLLPVLALVIVAGYLYRQAFEEARQDLNAASRIAQEHALKMLETNEMLLARMLDLLGTADEAALLARAVELHQRLKLMAQELPQVQGLFLHGADGRSLGTSVVYPAPRHIDYSDREWFRAHRSGKGRSVFVTEQLTSRATGEPFFDMSRRRVHGDGSFAGTVNVSLRPEYLTAFYKEMAVTTPGLRVAVLRTDGKLLARWPDSVPEGGRVRAAHPLMAQITRGVPAGMLESESLFDGRVRLMSFRRLGEYPLYVAVSFERKVLISGWAWQVALLSVFVVPMGCAFAWMSWLGLRRTREELDAVQRLDEETARRQRSEVALAHAQKLEAMGRLTGGVAHDFNNLLMVFVNNVHLLRRLHPQLAGSEQLAAIERALESGTRLTRQLLAFSRRQALTPEHIVLQERLDALLTLLRPVLPGSIEIVGSVAPDTGAILVDAAELELALINVALNARDAMDGGGRIEVAARNAVAGELDASGEYVVIEVTDPGCGIDPAVLDRVLEPFFTTKPVGKGSGLGLSQVQALCQSAGGTVRIESRPGGTRVRLFFARHVDDTVPAGAPDPAPSGLGRLACKLLLVEDNADLASSTAALLESLGCSVRHVEGARAALQEVAHRMFDVVLSDIEMPGEMDGIELATILQRNDPPLPVVLITGYASRLDEAKALGFEVLPKPCPPTTLVSAIASALSGHRVAGKRSA